MKIRFEDNCDRCGLRMLSDQKQRTEGGRLLCVSCTPISSGAPAPRVRELRVTDIRCGGCKAGPGMRCRLYGNLHVVNLERVHWMRSQEFDALVAEGWQWQEVDPRDAGAKE